MGEGGELPDFEGLVLDLGQEKQMKEVLELSVFEMKNTVAELEKRLNSVDDEDNEWKTRYETQIELNRQLERQIGLLQGKMEQVHESPTDRLASVRSFDQMHVDSLNQFLKQLGEEKKSLQNQLKDYELRLEQEAKAYHKANDERRAYLAVISQISGSLKPSERQKMDAVEMKREDQLMRSHFVLRHTPTATSLSPAPTDPEKLRTPEITCIHCLSTNFRERQTARVFLSLAPSVFLQSMAWR
ncbi:coiled-coil domain-containing protein 169 isoform X1 [Podarcis muralis]